MILFLTLLLISIILIVFIVLIASALGAGVIIIFGDVIVCVAIIALILRHFWKKRKDKED